MLEWKEGKYRSIDLSALAPEDESEVLNALFELADSKGVPRVRALALAYNRLAGFWSRQPVRITDVRSKVREAIDLNALAEQTGFPVELLQKALS